MTPCRDSYGYSTSSVIDVHVQEGKSGFGDATPTLLQRRLGRSCFFLRSSAIDSSCSRFSSILLKPKNAKILSNDLVSDIRVPDPVIVGRDNRVGGLAMQEPLLPLDEYPSRTSLDPDWKSNLARGAFAYAGNWNCLCVHYDQAVQGLSPTCPPRKTCARMDWRLTTARRRRIERFPQIHVSFFNDGLLPPRISIAAVFEYCSQLLRCAARMCNLMIANIGIPIFDASRPSTKDP